ncbi:MAG: helicase-exonuclease AddAB subunit AddA [Clostridia bacterium]|jgi:ATP-dependent helicase/nuclease subunit A|nr:helicase-exonuclease AddAB subunit AddA [Clostridia bacterium]
MGDIRWSEDQLKAINKEGGNILVSAAAGSGKTAVLVERIIRKIKEIDVSELLVVTYTNAAAAEMKERLIKAISLELELNPENEHLQRQMILINSASIMTMHSFCLEVIRNNFEKLGLDPNFKIGDNLEIKMLKKAALDEVLEACFSEENKHMIDFFDAYYNIKDGTRFEGLIFKFYDFVRSNPKPWEWLKESQEEVRAFNPIASLNHAKDDISWFDYDEINGKVFEEKYIKLLDECNMFIKELKLINTYEEMYDFLKTVKFSRMATVKDADEEETLYFKLIREKVKNNFSKITKKYFNIAPKYIDEINSKTLEYINVLSQITKMYDEVYSRLKDEKGILDFSDIEHKTLEVLENKEISNRYKEKFREILVDEYQDSSMIQETMINKISKDNIFMVGDIKQSIYRFRLASPEIFIGKYEGYNEDEEKGTLINLSKNFRCNKGIIDATNIIFESLLNKEIGEIDYDDRAKLYKGVDNDKFEKVNVNIIETEKKGTDAVILEATDIANRIKKLVKEEEYNYKDIVILFRSLTNVEVFEETLTSKGIPVYSDKDKGYFDTVEVKTIISFLEVIDNPRQDIPLVAIMKSPMFNFTSNELYKIRNEFKYGNFYDALQFYGDSVFDDELVSKTKKFLSDIKRYRELSGRLSLYEFIEHIYDDTNYYNYIVAMPFGQKRESNLRLLVRKAIDFEKTNLKGLFNFVNYINELGAYTKEENQAKVISENEDVVRMMSIHKSKGLEFKVVFVANLNKNMNEQDLKADIVYNKDMGIGIKYVDTKNKYTIDTIGKNLINKKAKKEMLSEELRVMYVALTRAKEKIYLSSIISDVEKNMESWENVAFDGNLVSRDYLIKAKSFIDILMPVFIKYNELFEINYLNDEEIDSKRVMHLNKYEDIEYETVDKEEYVFDYKASELPIKMSVTEIKRLADMDQDEGDLIELKKPNFTDEGKTDSLNKGIVIHKVFQNLDFENVEDSLGDLLRKKMISQEDLKIIDVNKLKKFTRSDIYLRMKNSAKVYKEQAFVLNIDGDIISEEYTKEDKILVQGVIDMFFEEDGKLVVVDYKTDNMENKTEEDLYRVYKKQLELYKYALEKLTGREVKECLIYFYNS